MKAFIVTIDSRQHGKIKIRTWAMSAEGAKFNVLAAENCPPSIVTVEEESA